MGGGTEKTITLRYNSDVRNENIEEVSTLMWLSGVEA